MVNRCLRMLNVVTQAIFCSCLAGCDAALAPVILNQYKDVVHISVAFKNGPSAPNVRLEPNTGLMQRKKGLVIAEISVTEPSGRVRVYKLPEFDRLRVNQKATYEVWSLSEVGVDLHDKAFYKTHLKDKAAARNKLYSR